MPHVSRAVNPAHGQGWHQPHAVWQQRFFKFKYFCSSNPGLPTPMSYNVRWSKWVAKAGLLCEVLLALLYNHLYYQIKYKMTAHNKVVTADTVSWPLPIITLELWIPLLQAIQGLAGTTTNKRLVDALYDVLGQLERGRTLSASLNRHPKIFNRLFVLLIC